VELRIGESSQGWEKRKARCEARRELVVRREADQVNVRESIKEDCE
jgi:hypothetical protein